MEFNEFAANFAEERFGLQIINRSIIEFDPQEEQFDCIMMWGVLEHLPQPQAVLDKVYQLLRANGVLVLEVPSADSILVRYFERFGGYVDRIIEGDRHICCFQCRHFVK